MLLQQCLAGFKPGAARNHMATFENMLHLRHDEVVSVPLMNSTLCLHCH